MSTATITKLKYNITANDGVNESVTFFHDGQEYVALKDHPNFDKIVLALKGGAPASEVIGFFDIGVGIVNQFKALDNGRLSDRVLVVGGKLLFDGMEMHGVLVDTILGLAHEQESVLPFVNFLEKIEQNPNPHSRAQLFTWLSANKFSITADGDILAYKGVDRAGRSGDDEQYLSRSSGKALVNGVWVTGKIPTSPGTIVEMPRDEVQHDPKVGCHTGLHAGDWSYASTFASVTLRVLINPRDVVSVPTDCETRKMRVCRYRVLARTNSKDETLLVKLDENELRTLVTAKQPKTEIKKPVKVAKLDVAAPETAIDKVAKAVKPSPMKTAPSTKAAPKKAAAKVADKVLKGKPAPVSNKTNKTTEKVSKSAPAKKAAAPVKKAVKPVMPKFYEEFKSVDFAGRPFNELRWLAKEWDVANVPSNPSKTILVQLLAKAAATRNRQLNKGTLKSKPVRVKK